MKIIEHYEVELSKYEGYSKEHKPRKLITKYIANEILLTKAEINRELTNDDDKIHYFINIVEFDKEVIIDKTLYEDLLNKFKSKEHRILKDIEHSYSYIDMFGKQCNIKIFLIIHIDIETRTIAIVEFKNESERNIFIKPDWLVARKNL